MGIFFLEVPMVPQKYEQCPTQPHFSPLPWLPLPPVLTVALYAKITLIQKWEFREPL